MALFAKKPQENGISGLEHVSSLHLVFLPSSDDPVSWDNAAVEQSICPSEGHDLAEPEALEAEAAFVSILHKRAVGELTICVRELTFCSIFVNETILAQRVLTIWSTLVILEVRRPTASLTVLT